MTKLIAKPFDEWTEEDGNVLWWPWPVTEPPFAGTPNDSDWPIFYFEKSIVWTPLIVPTGVSDGR